MARVDLNGVSKVYPGDKGNPEGVRAVDRISLNIDDKSFIVLVGPSGCGKSTTLRMVAGLEEISEGTITIGDRVVNNVAPKDRDIAMVFQNYALYPHMTCYKNMAFGLKLRKMPKQEIDRKVREAARILDIEHLLERKPKALSGGQRQRVAVGRAIVRDPACFLFDEPLSNLDAKLRVTTRTELKQLHQRLQTTTLYVTHDQEEAMTLGDRIVVMKDGHIQQSDSPIVTYANPANRFVAGFIGTPPMNFFEGQLREEGGELIFEEGELINAHVSGKGAADGEENTGDEPVVLEGDLNVPGDGFKVTIPPEQAAMLRDSGKVGGHVVLGVRPEHFSLDPIPGYSTIEAKLTAIEPLGHVMDAYLTTKYNGRAPGRIVARVGAKVGVETDVPRQVHLDLTQAHVFEPGELGMNLTLTNTDQHAVA